MVLLYNKFICFYVLILVLDRLSCNLIMDNKKYNGLSLNSTTVQLTFFFINQLFMHWSTGALNYVLIVVQVYLISNLYFKDQQNLTIFLLISLLIGTNVLLLSPSTTNLIILTELLNTVLIIILMISKKNKLTYKKLIYITLITTNVIVLSLLVLNKLILIVKTGCTDLEVIYFLLQYTGQNNTSVFIYLTILIKLGLFIGPKYNIHLYNNMDECTLTIYMCFYYVIFILLGLFYLKFVYITQYLMVFVWFGIILTNRSLLTGSNKTQIFFYWSNQIGLFYIQPLLV